MSGENSLTVTLGNIHCIHRLTFPLDPPMLLIFCSRVTVSANGPSSPVGTESPWEAKTGHIHYLGLASEQLNQQKRTKMEFTFASMSIQKTTKWNVCLKTVILGSKSRYVFLINTAICLANVHIWGSHNNATLKSFGRRWHRELVSWVKCCVKLSPVLTPE